MFYPNNFNIPGLTIAPSDITISEKSENPILNYESMLYRNGFDISDACKPLILKCHPKARDWAFFYIPRTESFWKRFCTALEANNSITEIHLDDVSLFALNPEQTVTLFTLFNNNKKIDAIHFCYSAKSLKNYRNTNEKLRTSIWRTTCDWIGNSQIVPLKNEHLRKITISTDWVNDISDTEWKEFYNSVILNTNITEFHVTGSNICPITNQTRASQIESLMTKARANKQKHFVDPFICFTTRVLVHKRVCNGLLPKPLATLILRDFLGAKSKDNKEKKVNTDDEALPKTLSTLPVTEQGILQNLEIRLYSAFVSTTSLRTLDLTEQTLENSVSNYLQLFCINTLPKPTVWNRFCHAVSANNTVRHWIVTDLFLFMLDDQQRNQLFTLLKQKEVSELEIRGFYTIDKYPPSRPKREKVYQKLNDWILSNNCLRRFTLLEGEADGSRNYFMRDGKIDFATIQAHVDKNEEAYQQMMQASRVKHLSI